MRVRLFPTTSKAEKDGPAPPSSLSQTTVQPAYLKLGRWARQLIVIVCKVNQMMQKFVHCSPHSVADRNRLGTITAIIEVVISMIANILPAKCIHVRFETLHVSGGKQQHSRNYLPSEVMVLKFVAVALGGNRIPMTSEGSILMKSSSAKVCFPRPGTRMAKSPCSKRTRLLKLPQGAGG